MGESRHTGEPRHTPVAASDGGLKDALAQLASLKRTVAEQEKRLGDLTALCAQQGKAVDALHTGPLASQVQAHHVALDTMQAHVALVQETAVLLSGFVAALREDKQFQHELILWARRTEKRAPGPLSRLIEGLAQVAPGTVPALRGEATSA